MGLPPGPSRFMHSLFVGLVLVSLCDAKVPHSWEGCGVPDVPAHGLSQCQPPLCEEPPHAGMFRPGTLMEFSCQAGYALAGLPALSICQGGEWHTVRELVCRPHGTHPAGSLIVATSVPLVVAAAVTLSALVVVVTACVMLTPRRSVCRCTESVGSAYEAMEEPEVVGHLDGDHLANSMDPPSYEEAVCGHLETPLPPGGHNSALLVLPEDAVVSCHDPCGPNNEGLTCSRALPSYQEALEVITSMKGRDVPEGELVMQHSYPVLGMENIC